MRKMEGVGAELLVGLEALAGAGASAWRERNVLEIKIDMVVVKQREETKSCTPNNRGRWWT